jgi:hypothetical protein
VEHSPERSVLSISEVFSLADAIDKRYRALILLATFANLRWGESEVSGVRAVRMLVAFVGCAPAV